MINRLSILIALLFLLFNSHSAEAQGIVFTEEPNVRQVMDQYAARNRLAGQIPGWRIQIMSTTDRRKMEATKEKFQREFPYMLTDFVHSPPLL